MIALIKWCNSNLVSVITYEHGNHERVDMLKCVLYLKHLQNFSFIFIFLKLLIDFSQSDDS